MPDMKFKLFFEHLTHDDYHLSPQGNTHLSLLVRGFLISAIGKEEPLQGTISAAFHCHWSDPPLSKRDLRNLSASSSNILWIPPGLLNAFAVNEVLV